MSRTQAEIEQEFQEAAQTLQRREAEEIVKLGESDDRQLRAAKLLTMIKTERARFAQLQVEREAKAAEMAERWVKAHEDLAVLRRSGILQ